MSRILSLTVLALVLTLTLPGCPPGGPKPAVTWTYLPEESSIWGITIDLTADGGYMVGGSHDSGYNMYALKLDALGNKTWDETYSRISQVGTPSELWRHEAQGLRQTADGGYIMLGSGHIEGDGLPELSFLLVKLDAAGNEVWAKTYAPFNPYDPERRCSSNRPAALDVTSDGGYMVVGYSYVGQYSLASILKTDADGNEEFCQVINDNAKAYEQIITGGQQTADNGYVLCGYSENGAPHGYMALLIKLDPDGNLEISKTYQYVPENFGAEAYTITQTADGGYVLGGELYNFITKAINHGAWLAKVDPLGNIDWMHYLNEADAIRGPQAIRETPQGDILAASSNHVGDMTLAKFTASGVHLWNYTLPDTIHGANASDILAVLETARDTVELRTGIRLETEIAIWS